MSKPNDAEPRELTREEHLQWCKARAMEYIAMGRPKDALVSMLSDLEKHPGTRNHPARVLQVQLQVAGLLDSLEEAERFIQGYH